MDGERDVVGGHRGRPEGSVPPVYSLRSRQLDDEIAANSETWGRSFRAPGPSLPTDPLALGPLPTHPQSRLSSQLHAGEEKSSAGVPAGGQSSAGPCAGCVSAEEFPITANRPLPAAKTRGAGTVNCHCPRDPSSIRPRLEFPYSSPGRTGKRTADAYGCAVEPKDGVISYAGTRRSGWFERDWSRRSSKLVTFVGDLERESHPFRRVCAPDLNPGAAGTGAGATPFPARRPNPARARAPKLRPRPPTAPQPAPSALPC